MGRWGQRLFEGDQDLDIVSDLDAEFIATGQADAHQEADISESLLDDQNKEAMRLRLDNGLGKLIFTKLRAEEDDPEHNWLGKRDGKYRVCIFGALMMRLGAQIDDEDMQHLREIVSEVPCRQGFQLPLCDDGFRDPGKWQFIAALEHYKPGTPRDFDCPSCGNCGRIKDDLGAALKKCAGCEHEVAYFCNKDCQKNNWPVHKKSCASTQKRNPNAAFISLNV
ncbi:hypothetical protein V8F20_012425 [Naviculisporaceae sp. PSN 640]